MPRAAPRSAAFPAIAEADRPGATNDRPVIRRTVAGCVVLSVGLPVLGLVVLRGGFGRAAAHLGVTTGVLGIVSVAGPFPASALGAPVIPASVLTTLLAPFVGDRLHQLDRP